MESRQAYYLNQEFMENVIGRGPSAFDTFYTDKRDNLGKTKMLSGEKKIHDSIKTILSTRVGERVFMPQFGSKLYLTLFENNSMIFRDLVEMYVKEALANWEKRVDVDAVQVSGVDDNNMVNILISYHIKNSNVHGSYVYPFNVSDSGITEIYDMEKGRDTISYM